MKVDIYSRKAIKELMANGFPKNTAVISFYTPKSERKESEICVDYRGVCDKVFYVGIPDIDIEILADYGYAYETYLSEANELAKFIYSAKEDGCDIICQCDYGQSRSAACAAAILQFYEGRGIDVFADYRYYPNQLVYHKVFDALKNRENIRTLIKMIFEEIKKLKIMPQGRWLPNQYGVFYSKLDGIPKRNFAKAMVELCERDFLKLEYDYYILTEKGLEATQTCVYHKILDAFERNNNSKNILSMFFITCFSRRENGESESPDFSDMRTFGYFDSFEACNQALHENWCDMHECLYEFAVIEQIEQGIHPHAKEMDWYRWDNEKCGFFEIDKPTETNGYCNYAIG